MKHKIVSCSHSLRTGIKKFECSCGEVKHIYDYEIYYCNKEKTLSLNTWKRKSKPLPRTWPKN